MKLAGDSMSRLRVVFIGQNGPFTIEPLKRLATKHDVIGIVEAAPRSAKGAPTKRALRQSRLRRMANARSVPYLYHAADQQDELGNFLETERPSLVCISSMSHLLRKDIIEIPSLGTINCHPSLLPKYRGPNPCLWQYLGLEKQGGVTIHCVDEGEDTGDILAQEAFPIRLGMPFREMSEELVRLSAKLVLKAVDDLAVGNAERRRQSPTPCSVRARNVRRDEPLIEWTRWPIEHVWHVLRGTDQWLDPLPMPPASTYCMRWRIGEYIRGEAGGPPGSIAKDKNGSYAAHPEGRIRLFLRMDLKMRYRRLIAALVRGRRNAWTHVH